MKSFFKRPSPRTAFTLSFLFAYTILFSGVVLAWSGPTATAPGNNVSAPINVGSTAQIKTGGIWASSVGSDSGYCIGTSCITSWPSASTDLWTKSGSNIYYGSGNVSVTNGGFSESLTNTNSNASSYGFSQMNNITSSGTYYDRAGTITQSSNILSGVTNNGYQIAEWIQDMRNQSGTGDSGTLNELAGLDVVYGHYNTDPSATPQTTTAFGIDISPYALTGTIGTMYDLYLGGTSGSGVTTHYGVYQSGSALNYFGGKIGIGTTSPSAPLSVNGGIYGNSSMNLGGDVQFGATSATNYLYFHGTQLNIAQAGVNTRLTINSSGNVGIGTTNPITPLHVGGTSGWQASFGASGSALQISPNQIATQGSGALLLNGSQGGYVGVGTTNPTQDLTIGAPGSAGSSFYNLGASTIGVGSSLYSYGYICTGNSAGSCQGSGGVVMAGNNLTAAGTISASAFLYTSDQSLKKDVQTIPDALSIIEKLRGVSFEWIKDSRPDMGVIAQEVQKVLPQLVHTDSATGLESVEYGNLIGVVIEAIKQVQGEIAELQQENTTLQQQNAQLTQEVQQLQAQQQTLEQQVQALETAR